MKTINVYLELGSLRSTKNKKTKIEEKKRSCFSFYQKLRVTTFYRKVFHIYTDCVSIHLANSMAIKDFTNRKHSANRTTHKNTHTEQSYIDAETSNIHTHSTENREQRTVWYFGRCWAKS